MNRPRSVCLCLQLLLILLLSPAVNAREIAGVSLDDTATLATGKTLVLNGAGIRKKLFFKIYVGALYLEQQSSEAEAILNSGKANRVLMHFIYDGVSKKKITDGWNTGFNKNLSAEELDKLKPLIDNFNALFTDTKTNDRVLLDYLPGKGTRVSMNGKARGLIEGEDFNRALLAIWLGKEPVTTDLKNAMLGK